MFLILLGSGTAMYGSSLRDAIAVADDVTSTFAVEVIKRKFQRAKKKKTPRGDINFLIAFATSSRICGGGRWIDLVEYAHTSTGVTVTGLGVHGEVGYAPATSAAHERGR
jgi:hypothetical protein